uniref:Endonuclease/exonuclease/phosphatase domain-containing protein n=1 Tax=Octopus bimaculoides TaxID=37653 RepID=A0A0L8HXX2_OCTBM
MRSQTKGDQTPSSRPQRQSKQRRAISSARGLIPAEEGNAYILRLGNLLLSGRNTTKSFVSQHLNFGAWNICTLQDKSDIHRLEQRTALVCKELTRFNIDIAALSETRLPGEGSIRDAGSKYTIFGRGRILMNHVSMKLSMELASPSKCNSWTNIDSSQLPSDRFLTLISVYAPTLTSEDVVKASFYNLLDRTIQTVPTHDKLVVLGDFKGRVGSDHCLWNGHHSIGKCNANDQFLLGLCAELELVITNSLFRRTTRQKQPGNTHDDCWMDHRLLISRFDIKIRYPPKQVSANIPCRRFDCAKLQNSQASQDFGKSIARHLMDLPEPTSIEDRWTSLREAMTAAAEETIGFSRKKGQDWFDENDETISCLIEAKLRTRLAFENHVTAENKRKRQQASVECQRGIREAQKIWQGKAEEMQIYADQRDLRSFYAATKVIFGPTRSSLGGLKNAAGPTITDTQGILDRWKSHIKCLLNDHLRTPDDVLQNTTQLLIHHWMPSRCSHTMSSTKHLLA